MLFNLLVIFTTSNRTAELSGLLFNPLQRNVWQRDDATSGR